VDDPIPTARRHEITTLATRWLGSWPRPSVDVFVPIDEPDEE
jgi:hypothetical protein